MFSLPPFYVLNVHKQVPVHILVHYKLFSFIDHIEIPTTLIQLTPSILPPPIQQLVQPASPSFTYFTPISPFLILTSIEPQLLQLSSFCISSYSPSSLALQCSNACLFFCNNYLIVNCCVEPWGRLLLIIQEQKYFIKEKKRLYWLALLYETVNNTGCGVYANNQYHFHSFLRSIQ